MSPPSVVPAGTVVFPTSVHPPETNGHDDDIPDWLWDKVAAERVKTLYDLEISPSTTFRHSGWGDDRQKVHHSLQRAGASLARIYSFETCGNDAYVLQSIENPTRYRIAGSACHDRFCLPCGQERSRTIANNVLERLDGKACRFLTLTVAARGLTLKAAIKHLTRSFATLRRTKLWARTVTGGAAFLEVKWIRDSERWHPHLHCLLEGKYLPQKEIADLWFQVTGDSRIVDIRLARNAKMVVHYVVKYASKPLDHSLFASDDTLDEAVRALKGTRMCTTFGEWRGLKLLFTAEEGGWLDVGSLADWLERAAWGDDEARKVLITVGKRRAEEAIATVGPRPPPSVTRQPSRQLLLDFEATAIRAA
jgi:hypothetical protein